MGQWGMQCPNVATAPPVPPRFRPLAPPPILRGSSLPVHMQKQHQQQHHAVTWPTTSGCPHVQLGRALVQHPKRALCGATCESTTPHSCFERRATVRCTLKGWRARCGRVQLTQILARLAWRGAAARGRACTAPWRRTGDGTFRACAPRLSRALGVPGRRFVYGSGGERTSWIGSGPGIPPYARTGTALPLLPQHRGGDTPLHFHPAGGF